jgi:hypothetical protein
METGKSVVMIPLNTKAFVDVRMSRNGSTGRVVTRYRVRSRVSSRNLTKRCLLMWTSDGPPIYRVNIPICTAHTVKLT